MLVVMARLLLSRLLATLLVSATSASRLEHPAEPDSYGGGSVYNDIQLQLNKDGEAALFTPPQQLDMEMVQKLAAVHPHDILLGAASTDVTAPCREAINLVTTGFQKFDVWTLKMLDSWGKIGSGLLDGHNKFLGNYDQCKNITGIYNVSIGNKSEMTQITTHYCGVLLPILPPISAQLGVCVPDQCNATDVWKLYNYLLSSVLHVPLKVNKAICKNEDYKLDESRITALVCVSLVIGLCIVATFFDGVLQLIAGRNAEKLRNAIEDDNETIPLLGKPDKRLQPNPERGLLTKTILAFSLYSNAGKILNTDQPAGTLTCLNGIRFFSMTWVILGHSLLLQYPTVLNNPVLLLDLFRSFGFSVILNATVSVDTFFILSGLLVCYLLLRDFHRRRIQIKDFFKALPMIYLHRYIRLTPAYGFLILIYTTLLWFVMDGPLWINYTKPPYQTLDQNCVDHWYLNLLYVNNIFQVDKQCAGWGWYLANDFQFFLISPFVILAFYLFSYMGIAVCLLTILGSITAALTVANSQGSRFAVAPFANNNFTSSPHPKLPYYMVPWCRYQTYGVGMLAGFLVWKLKQINFRIPKVLNLALWGVSAGLCMAVVYGPYAANQDYHTVTLAEADFYNGLARTAWAVGVCYVIISCCLGQGGWIGEFLSWKGFVPLGRLTYCAYLVHIPVQLVMYHGARSGTYYTNVTLAQSVILTITIAYLVAFLFSLVYEAPFINLDKLYLLPLSLKMGRDNTSSVGGKDKTIVASSSGEQEKPA